MVYGILHINGKWVKIDHLDDESRKWWWIAMLKYQGVYFMMELMENHDEYRGKSRINGGSMTKTIAIGTRSLDG